LLNESRFLSALGENARENFFSKIWKIPEGVTPSGGYPSGMMRGSGEVKGLEIECTMVQFFAETAV
jgi:hypothetical protein